MTAPIRQFLFMGEQLETLDRGRVYAESEPACEAMLWSSGPWFDRHGMMMQESVVHCALAPGHAGPHYDVTEDGGVFWPREAQP